MTNETNTTFKKSSTAIKVKSEALAYDIKKLNAFVNAGEAVESTAAGFIAFMAEPMHAILKGANSNDLIIARLKDSFNKGQFKDTLHNVHVYLLGKKKRDGSTPSLNAVRQKMAILKGHLLGQILTLQGLGQVDAWAVLKAVGGNTASFENYFEPLAPDNGANNKKGFEHSVTVFLGRCEREYNKNRSNALAAFFVEAIRDGKGNYLPIIPNDTRRFLNAIVFEGAAGAIDDGI